MVSRVVLLLTVLAGPGSSLEAAWSARAARATQKLAGPGLDACDRAVETAFREVSSRGDDAAKTYVLEIRIGTEHMFAGYAYANGKLRDFQLYGVPATWMVHQPADSKTVSVVLGGGPRCAFDLCANDPFSDGPCAK